MSEKKAYPPFFSFRLRALLVCFLLIKRCLFFVFCCFVFFLLARWCHNALRVCLCICLSSWHNARGKGSKQLAGGSTASSSLLRKHRSGGGGGHFPLMTWGKYVGSQVHFDTFGEYIECVESLELHTNTTKKTSHFITMQSRPFSNVLVRAESNPRSSGPRFLASLSGSIKSMWAFFWLVLLLNFVFGFASLLKHSWPLCGH